MCMGKFCDGKDDVRSRFYTKIILWLCQSEIFFSGF